MQHLIVHALGVLDEPVFHEGLPVIGSDHENRAVEKFQSLELQDKRAYLPVHIVDATVKQPL